MREILFRGKAEIGGNWVYGDVIHRLYGTSIGVVESDGLHELDVDEETVGQYTGLQDKNGTKIFEGDIIRDDSANCVGVIKFGKYGIYDDYGFYVDWGEEPVPAAYLRNDLPLWVEYRAAVVIGNIYDNPELLEVE